MGRHPKPCRQEWPGGARDRGDRGRGRTHLREPGAGQTSGKRMNKKKFPKTVLRTADQMRESAAAPAPKPISDNVIEMVPKTEGSAAVAVAPAPSAADTEAARQRRRRATAIVERYANFSAVGGAIPIPVA